MSRNLADETADYLKGVAQARHWPSSACWKCHRRRPGPHKCPARSRTRFALLAFTWACCAGLCALPWLFPAVLPFAERAQWPFGVFTGAVIGWHERGRARDGKLPLFDQLLLVVLAAFASELIVPGLWAYIPVSALLGVSALLIWRARSR